MPATRSPGWRRPKPPAGCRTSLATASDDGNLELDEAFFRAALGRPSCIVLPRRPGRSHRSRKRASLSRLIEAVVAAFESCRVVVTSRPGAYAGDAVLSGFVEAQIEPLGDEEIHTFLGRWCEALYAENVDDASAHRQEPQSALRSRPEIRRMARNPVMLTALAVVHWNERRLPEQRADLYESIVKWLARSRERKPGRLSAERCVTALQELALAMQRHSNGRQVQVTRRWAAEALALGSRDEALKGRVDEAERFVGEEEVDSGILVGRGNEVRFWHLTFPGVPDGKSPMPNSMHSSPMAGSKSQSGSDGHSTELRRI